MGRLLAAGVRRYWLPRESIQGEVVKIEGDAFHHIFDVCRQEVGSKFEVLGEPGRALLVEVTSVQKKNATARIIETRTVPALPKPHLVLALSVSRYHVMDSVVERAVEMGVARIQPFFSEFSFVRQASSLPAAKLDRWRKIVVSATQQSGRGELMPVSEPVSFETLLKTFNQQKQVRGLFAYEGGARQAIRDFTRGLSSSEEEVWIFVGSEGGFSTTEVQRFQDLGLAPVTLGDQVLRVETACIALVSILKYELGQMASQSGEA